MLAEEPTAALEPDSDGLALALQNLHIDRYAIGARTLKESP
jgi:hypothetical protein